MRYERFIWPFWVSVILHTKFFGFGLNVSWFSCFMIDAELGPLKISLMLPSGSSKYTEEVVEKINKKDERGGD